MVSEGEGASFCTIVFRVLLVTSSFFVTVLSKYFVDLGATVAAFMRNVVYCSELFHVSLLCHGVCLSCV